MAYNLRGPSPQLGQQADETPAPAGWGLSTVLASVVVTAAVAVGVMVYVTPDFQEEQRLARAERAANERAGKLLKEKFKQFKESRSNAKIDALATSINQILEPLIKEENEEAKAAKTALLAQIEALKGDDSGVSTESSADSTGVSTSNNDNSSASASAPSTNASASSVKAPERLTAEDVVNIFMTKRIFLQSALVCLHPQHIDRMLNEHMARLKIVPDKIVEHHVDLLMRFYLHNDVIAGHEVTEEEFTNAAKYFGSQPSVAKVQDRCALEAKHIRENIRKMLQEANAAAGGASSSAQSAGALPTPEVSWDLFRQYYKSKLERMTANLPEQMKWMESQKAAGGLPQKIMSDFQIMVLREQDKIEDEIVSELGFTEKEFKEAERYYADLYRDEYQQLLAPYVEVQGQLRMKIAQLFPQQPF
eukprot:g1493.t1